MPRTVSAIDADIAATEARLRALHDERRQKAKARCRVIVADFDGGMSVAQISEKRRLGYSIVQGILYRAGRTERGRAAVQQQLRNIGP